MMPNRSVLRVGMVVVGSGIDAWAGDDRVGASMNDAGIDRCLARDDTRTGRLIFTSNTTPSRKRSRNETDHIFVTKGPRFHIRAEF